uniref:Amyloid beta (A4) precursor protein-binding, family A, member 1b n=1 Tax=Astatotilapia calliptera TaxID=8154 RepID=A0A3P8RIY6_ASTCA
MSHKYQGEATGEGSEEHKEVSGPPRSRQPNGTTGDPPARRSWRPCQMLNQDGELNPLHHHHPPPHHHHHHHHHHPPGGRGPPRHRRRPPSGQGQGQSQPLSPVSAPAAVSQDADPRPVQQPRAAVTRYRRHGDPNPRLRSHRQRQPFREVQDSSPGVEEREGPRQVQVQVQESSTADPVVDQSQDRESSHQTPIAVVTPTHLASGAAPREVQLDTHNAPPDDAEEDLQESKMECEQESDLKEDHRKQEKVGDEDGDHRPGEGHSGCGHDEKAEEYAERVEEDEERVMDNVEEDPSAQGSEITDLCSDTESAASLSMDGPLHSPPPLHSPTPPSSPDVPAFPQLDHFGEDASMSPLPDNDLPPEEEEDEDCSESCSLSHSTSCSESYPKTYADFYTESHQKSYSEPVYESYSESKPHPNSFPEPLKTSYPEPNREPRRQASQRTEANRGHQESRQEPFTPHRQENVQKGALPSPIEGSHHVPRQARDRRSQRSPLDRSVGCRLHHYDGQSDGEGGSADQSPVTKNRRQPPRQPETQAKTPPSGLSSSGEAQDEQNAEGAKGSGDAISLAIKDIKEAIEGVKTKTMRSPYTPDQPVEPIWVMRQEVSPTEDMYPLQTTAGHSSPHSPPESASESPSCYTSAPVRDPVSPLRVDHSSRAPNPQSYHTGQSQHNHHHHLHQQGHQSQQRDAARSPQTYTQPQPYPHMPPNQHQQCQHQQQQQQLPSQQPQTQAQQQSPPQKPSVQEAAQKQAKNRKKSPDDEAPSTAEVDLFMSTQRIKVLNADTQECLMDLPLRTISYIADIGNMVVLMARGKMVRSRSAQENLDSTAEQTTITQDDRRLYRMICHVFESEDAQLIAQSIGQSFSVAYQEFLRANGIDPEDLSQREYSDLLNTQDMYNDDLIHFSKSENCRDVYIEKQKGEILGVVIVESGWGSILPTVIIASMMHAGPAEKSGRLNIGDQIMTINGTSLVGLPLSTCQSIIKGLKSQSRIKMNIVRCPPVTMVLIRRPDLRYQLGFSVQNGIICSLMRGGIAERGGVRVGHRIIEINSQSVVATPHEKIVQILSNAMGEIHMKTMPAAMYRLLTAQEQPVYI